MSTSTHLRDTWNGCPYYRLMGMTVEHVDAASSTLRLTVTEDHLQAYGTAHGGAIAGLIDAAMGLAILGVTPPGEGCATIEMKLNFTGPARPGAVTATGRVLHLGRRIVTAAAEAHDGEGVLVAAGQGTFMRFVQEGDR